MKALVLADRSGAALGPLGEKGPVALMPVGGLPLVVRAIQGLSAAGVDEVLVAVSEHAERLEEELGDGRRWGVRLEILLTRGDAAPIDVASRVAGKLDAPFLALRGDVFLAADFARFVERAKTIDDPLIPATCDGRPTGLLLARGLDALADVPRASDDEAWEMSIDGVELDPACFSRVASLAELHRVNMELLDGHEAVDLPGREVAVGVRVGRQSRVALRAVQDQPVLVGARVEVHPRAEVLDHVVLSGDVVVDQGATLRRTLVLPGTYVGELVELDEAIVWSNLLVRVDTGAVAQVTDTFLLADLRRATLGSLLESLAHRVGGAVLLLASLPLWPVMLAASFLANPRTPFRRVRMIGNRMRTDSRGERGTEFELLLPATRIPLLRALPGLEAVVTGDMRLVGVPPLSREEAASRREEWELVRDEAPAGLVAPSKIGVPPTAPHEERAMMDAFYARTRSLATDLRWLARGAAHLFTRRAWRHAPRH